MERDRVSILDGNTFVVSDRRGDIEASPSAAEGLFHDDTRYLSRWNLTIDGERPGVLSVDDLSYFATQFFLALATGTIYVDRTISVLRKRAVGQGFHEDLVLMNHAVTPVRLSLRVEVAADFADLFEVKDALEKKGTHYARVEGSHLVLGYRRQRFVRETRIFASAPARVDERGLSFQLELPPHGRWSTCLDVVAARELGGQVRTHVKYGHDDVHPRPNLGTSLERWLDAAPKLISSWTALERIYHRSLVDLAALRFYPRVLPAEALPAAGLPWFMTMFGRDSILTSLQALPFVPELARTTLRVLPLFQGTRVDDFRDEEPGKILHELRFGELTAFEERPQSPYYGSADATPLYLVLLDEYERWSGDEALVRELEPAARAALEWIDRYGDRDGDGYVEYQTRNPASGLPNQCWKDSDRSILYADGTLAPLPRATCEIQGYVYDAKRRLARLARRVFGDLVLAERLDEEASALKARFNRDFWIPARSSFALALDGEKRRVDALTSNIGHLLFSGIVDDDKAPAIAAHLLGPALFSGWGVRTMADGEGGYNPIGYHVGTVWPHDTALVAWGLRRYGFREEAAALALAMLEAAHLFAGRLPEAFAGYARHLTEFPVEYPTACSPQAWATAAPLPLLRVMLGLQPIDGHLLVDPAIPQQLHRLELLSIPGRWGHADAFGRGRITISSRRSSSTSGH